MQSNLDKRLTLLEQQRPDGVLRVEDMTDEQLIRIITGGQATTISDDQLDRTAKGKSSTYGPSGTHQSASAG